MRLVTRLADILGGSGRPTPEAAYRPRARRSPEDDAAFQLQRRRSQFRQELMVRSSVCVLVLVFNELLGLGTSVGADMAIRTTALAGLLLNGPYYVAARSGERFRQQAYGRMAVDVVLLTLGLYGAGGLSAASYVGVYTIIPVYAGIVLSGAACLVATAFATVSFLVVVLLQHTGWLTTAVPPTGAHWAVAGFNLLILNVVGWLTANLADVYRENRRRLGVLYQDLERAHDESFRLNAEIQRAARLNLLGEFVPGISHEIRNVLQLVFGHLELMRPKVKALGPEVMRHVDEVEQSCETAMRIVKNALDSARQPSAESVLVSLKEVARRTVELKGYDFRRDGISAQLDFPPDFPPVLAARFQLQQVLLNLVTNAQDALRGTREPRTIMIVGLPERERAVVEVRDSGPGIPTGILPRLFEPFYTTKASGTGLGLAISASIIRSLGGDLTAGNRREGGAVFRIALPAARQPPAASADRP